MTQARVILKSFNGIGDLLFVTPTLRMIKETYNDAVKIKINTNHPGLVLHNPFVDEVGQENDGLFLAYPDPIHLKQPTQHHILTDWELVCSNFNLTTPVPKLLPELFTKRKPKCKDVGVQVLMTGKYGGKKDWPHAQELVNRTGWEAIPRFRSVIDLAEHLSSYRIVICPEGGIMHMATALGIPCVAIFGGFIHPAWTGYQQNINLSCRLDCSDDCYNHHPCKNRFKHICWESIAVGDVISAARILFERTYGSSIRFE